MEEKQLPLEIPHADDLYVIFYKEIYWYEHENPAYTEELRRDPDYGLGFGGGIPHRAQASNTNYGVYALVRTREEVEQMKPNLLKLQETHTTVQEVGGFKKGSEWHYSWAKTTFTEVGKFAKMTMEEIKTYRHKVPFSLKSSY